MVKFYFANLGFPQTLLTPIRPRSLLHCTWAVLPSGLFLFLSLGTIQWLNTWLRLGTVWRRGISRPWSCSEMKVSLPGYNQYCSGFICLAGLCQESFPLLSWCKLEGINKVRLKKHFKNPFMHRRETILVHTPNRGRPWIQTWLQYLRVKTTRTKLFYWCAPFCYLYFSYFQ